MPIESTYRLQFHKGFTFDDAAAIVDYLADLGVTHAYASPYLKAQPGSTHGYDVIDHCKLNPEVGTTESFERWCDRLKSRGLQHILDIVPNHVGVATNDNVWWNDVLQNGPRSKFRDYFDITWDGPTAALKDKVLLPLLGDSYGNVLEKGELKVVLDERGPAVTYYDRRFPLDPTTLDIEPARLASLNGTPGDAASFDRLHHLLQRQHYRLAWWRTAGDEINYRRFFDINDLAALAMEHQEVFDATHKFILELVDSGTVAGLRVDHPDGLLDPEQYLRRLQEAGADYVVVEKILGPEEPLPPTWKTAGTTGYDFLSKINALFVDTAAEPAFTNLYADWTDAEAYVDIVYRNKARVLDTSLASELTMLSYRVERLAQRDRTTQDFTFSGIRRTLRELIACFPVYRSYISPRGVGDRDRADLDAAIAAAEKRNRTLDKATVAFLRELLLSPDREGVIPIIGKFQQLTAPDTAKGIEDTTFYQYNRLVSLNEVGGEPGRFGETAEFVHAYLADRQQYWPTSLSPLSTHDTKRSEDVRARINALSELPDDWKASVEAWSYANRKLSEAGRASAIEPNEEYLLYQTLIGAWPLGAAQVDETFVKRIQAYMLKAMREAKQRTTWTDPDEQHEKSVADFTAAILTGPGREAFLEQFLPLQQRVVELGLTNSLAQTLLRLTAPGVPDTYQGSELWDFSLVDPDNRRPVDYAARREMLQRVRNEAEQAGADRTAFTAQLFARRFDGAVKLYLTATALHARQQHPGLFTRGSYEPLRFGGRHAAQLFGFTRRLGDVTAAVIVPRFTAKLLSGQPAPLGADIWADTAAQLPSLPSGYRWRELLRGVSLPAEESSRIGELFQTLPVALLVNEPG